MTLAGRIIRIRSDAIRVPLFLLIFPWLMLRFAVGLAWNAPRRFFTAEPWDACVGAWWAAGMGAFVPEDD